MRPLLPRDLGECSYPRCQIRESHPEFSGLPLVVCDARSVEQLAGPLDDYVYRVRVSCALRLRLLHLDRIYSLTDLHRVLQGEAEVESQSEARRYAQNGPCTLPTRNALLAWATSRANPYGRGFQHRLIMLTKGDP